MKKFSVSLRPASEDDLAQVTSIEASSLESPWSEKSFRAELEKKYSHFWVLTDDDTDEIVFGYIVFALPVDQAHIQTMAVAKDYRKQGYAKKILKDMIAYALRQEATSVVLEVRKDNKAALALYQGLGFVVTHNMEYPDGTPGYSMVLRLDGVKPLGKYDGRVKKQNIN